MKEIFDFVCVTLHSRSNDRGKSIIQLFKRLNLTDSIHWWIVEKHPSGGIYGCCESNVSIWNCSEFTKPFLCIFEDDLECLDESLFEEALQYAIQNMPHNFNFFNLEPQLGFIKEKLSSFGRINGYLGEFLHTGCYIVHRSILPQLTASILPWYGMDLDVALYKNCKMAGIFPPIFKQKAFESDNTGSHRDLLPDALKRINIGQKMI